MKIFEFTKPISVGEVITFNLQSGPAEIFFVKRVDHGETHSTATLQRWNTVTERVLRGRPLTIHFVLKNGVPE